MDSNRRSTRHLEPKDGSSQASAVDPSRLSTADSGRGSLATSERASTVEIITASGTSSALSRDTPLDDDHDNEHKKCQDDRPVRIQHTPVLGSKRYEQAFVSHIDHPSAFFLQLAHSHQKYEDLHIEINEFYSTNSMNNPSEWKSREYCIAKYTDNKYYRGRIVEVPKVTGTTDVYDVVFLDFGNWDKIAKSDIHLLLPKFARLPAHAIPCSLTKSLPNNGSWSQHPEAIELFKKLVFEKFVDATFQLKSNDDFWPLSFVDLQLSASKLNIRECMKEAGHIRDASSQQIYIEFSQSFSPQDYIIYSIPHEDDDNDDDDGC